VCYIVPESTKIKQFLNGRTVYEPLSDSPVTGVLGLAEPVMRVQKFDMIVSLACCALLGFFAWHAFKGPRSFAYREKLGVQVAKLETEVAAITKKRDAFEARVKLLRPESVDPDMLDEMARQTLSVGKPNELILPVEP
jgi:cell division protein FtsB